MIARLDQSEAGFLDRLDRLSEWDEEHSEEIDAVVRGILKDVRTRGDAALVELTNRFDRREITYAGEMVLGRDVLEQAFDGLPGVKRDAIMAAAARIKDFHGRQVESSWRYEDDAGNGLGQQITPLDRVGIYVPGGKAAYPSSVLMNAVPAKVAGVGEIIMTVPAPDGALDAMVLAAAHAAEVDTVVTVGGAQAIAALAHGTVTVPRVDKIVGPGNIYVATAKRMVFGMVGIDMVAGPSEVLIVSDGSVPADWLAMDLFAQAEHDEDARAVLVSPDESHLDDVAQSIANLIGTMERRPIIERSLATRGALVKVHDLDAAVDVVNRLAPEHLELALADPHPVLPRIRHAGAIFLGAYSAEAFGDYCAGPNHVLPTARTARFSSPLGVYDFVKRSSVIDISADGARHLAPIASVLARGERLTAHARSAEMRAGNLTSAFVRSGAS
jgi:histidinol dehydrogenase